MAKIEVETSDLEKIADALGAAHRFFLNRDTMNAAVHLAESVRYSPLTSTVEAEVERVAALLRGDH